MKAPSTTKVKRGMSTLEILIAACVLTTALAASVVLVFGNENAAVQSQIYQEALYKAKAQLEQARADAREDFSSLEASSTSEVSGPIVFVKSFTVSQSDPFLVQATSTVSWTQFGKTQKVELTTLIADFEQAKSGSTCSSVVSGDWSSPTLSPAVDLGGSAGGNSPTAVVAFHKKLYVTSDTTGVNNDFYIFDIASPMTPILTHSSNTNALAAGINDIALSKDAAGVYAYLANGVKSNWSVCNTAPNCAQLEILNVTDPKNVVHIKDFRLPNITHGSFGRSVGKSVAYSGGYLYLGLTYAGGEHEFNIIDVGGGGAPATPATPRYVGGYTVGAAVNSIAIKDGYAYLATSNNAGELLVLDVHTPSSPTMVGLFDAPGDSGFGDGNRVTIAGKTAYLGRAYDPRGAELYQLNATNPAALSVLTAHDIGATSANADSIEGLVIRGPLGAVLTQHFFQLWNISPLKSMTQVKSLSLKDANVTGDALACEGNYLYIAGHRNATNKGLLYAISPAP